MSRHRQCRRQKVLELLARLLMRLRVGRRCARGISLSGRTGVSPNNKQNQTYRTKASLKAYLPGLLPPFRARATKTSPTDPSRAVTMRQARKQPPRKRQHEAAHAPAIARVRPTRARGDRRKNRRSPLSELPRFPRSASAVSATESDSTQRWRGYPRRLGGDTLRRVRETSRFLL